MIPKYQIGQDVHIPTFDSHEEYVTCPDCGGTGRIRLITHDDVEHSIPCQGCTRGYEEPTGKVVYWAHTPRVLKGKIVGVEFSGGVFEYRIEGWRGGHNVTFIMKESDVSVEEGPAMDRALARKTEHENEQVQHILRKEKDTRSWAWHVSHHRKAIKDAEEKIRYHTAKLNHAKIKAKDKTDDAR